MVSFSSYLFYICVLVLIRKLTKQLKNKYEIVYDDENVVIVNKFCGIEVCDGEENVEKLLTKYDVILPKKRNYYIETNYSHYVHAHHQEPLDKTREIIQASYPQYLVKYDEVMKRSKAHMFNMFIMKRDVFESYCSFMFGVLGKLEKQVDLTGYSVQEKRVYGYISELLMDVWLETNAFNYTELKWGQLGGKNNVKKAISLVERKIGITTKTHF